MKSYILCWNADTGCYVEVMKSKDERKDFEKLTYPLWHVVRHSPTGFNWGYAGSGPADCALSILTDCLGEERAERWYQEFKRQFLTGLPRSGGVITEEAIREFIEAKEAEYAETYSR